MSLKFLSLALTAAGIAGVAPSGAAQNSVAIPSFVEETASAGINSIYAGEWEYTVGGGIATFDCNDDGFADMLLAGGTSPAKFYRNASTRGGALRFETQESGLELDKVSGTYPLDIDSDGITDLVLLRVGENVVMRGLGKCRFERANESWGFDGGDGWSTALAATWEKGADWPTVAIGNYIDRSEQMSPWGSCTDNWLHRPSVVDGKTQNKFAAPLALKPSFCPLSMLFTDWNRSGTPSLRISNDREYYEGGQEQMWRITPNEAPALYTEKEGWKPLRIWGMGIASYDLNSDGYPEYFLTSMADNKLQIMSNVPQDGQPKPDYKDVAFAKGVTAHRPYVGDDLKPSTAWHAQFEDVNNDGLVDLFIVKGNVAKMPDFAAKDPNNLLLQASDGKFQEAGDKAGVASGAVGRGGALVDFNLDGLLDMVVVNRWETAQLWRNTSSNAGRWIQVKLQQPGPNRDGVGSWLEVKCGETVTRREITIGGGHASGQSGWWHVGVGDTAKPEVRVVWTDGTTSEWQPVESNNFFILERGKPAQAWVARVQ
jgi:enediyne biosynthesis protein E4